jgi:uncharacterized protein (DUF433 family)
MDEMIREVADKLTATYPLIVVDGELGEPRLDGTRFAVANVLSALVAYQSFDQVVEEYDGQYTEEQITQAIQFARDFLLSFYRYKSSLTTANP